MADLIDKVVEDYNRMMTKVDKKHPWCYNLRKKFVSNKRYGFQILDDKGKVIEEYTLTLAAEPYIDSYEQGIKDVCWLTKAVKASALEEFFENEQDYIDKPFRTILKSFKYLFNGSVTLGKKKK